MPTTWKLDVLDGPTLSTNRRTRSPGFAGSGLVDHAVVAAVEHRVGRRLGAHAFAIEHVKRLAVDLALLRIELGVELALHHRVFAIDLGRIAVARLDDHHAVHARRDMLEHHRRAAVIHEDARDSWRVNSKLIVCPGAIERYLSCGETIAAWKSIECIIGAAITCKPGTGSSLRLVIENLMRSPTRARTDGSRNLVAEGPGAELHARRDFDDLVRRVESNFLDLARR